MTNPPLPYDIDSNGESLMGDGQGTRVEPAAPVAAYLEGLCIKVMGCDYTPTPEEFGTVLGMAMGREGVEVPAGDPARDGGADGPMSAALNSVSAMRLIMAGVQKKSEFGHGYAAALEDVTSRLKYENRVTAAPQPEPGAGEDDAAFVAWHGAEARGEVGAGDDAAFVDSVEHTLEHNWLPSTSEGRRLITLARRGARAPVGLVCTKCGNDRYADWCPYCDDETPKLLIDAYLDATLEAGWREAPGSIAGSARIFTARGLRAAAQLMRSRAAPVEGAEPVALRLLREHHEWHLLQGEDNGELEGVDLGEAYTESDLCTRTYEALGTHPSAPPAPTAERRRPNRHPLTPTAGRAYCAGCGEPVVACACEHPHGLQTPSAEAPAGGDPRTQDLTWFWEIIDAEGLADVPSVETDALRILCNRAARPRDDLGAVEAAVLEEPKQSKEPEL